MASSDKRRISCRAGMFKVLLGEGPQELLWAGSQAAAVKVIINGIFYHLNYCVIIYFIYTQLTNTYPGRITHGDGFVVVSPAVGCK